MVARVIDHPFNAGVIPSPYNTDPALLAIVEIIRTGLIRDQHVRLHKFGTFRLRWSKERRIKHPKTGESITVAPAPRITFTPAKQLREWIEPNRKPVIPLKEPLNDPLEKPLNDPLEESFSEPLNDPAKSDPKPEQTRLSDPVKTSQKTEDFQTHSGDSLQEAVQDIIDEQYSPTNSQSGFTKPQAKLQIEPEVISNPEEPQKSNKKWALGLLAAVPLIVFLLQSDFKNESSGNQENLPPEIQQEAKTNSVPEPILNNAVIKNKIIRAKETASDDQQSNTIHKPTALITARTEPTPRPFYMSPQVHTIQQGENLWNLAKQFYGDALLWPHIYRANTRTLSDPDKIISGKDLVIPGLQESPELLTRKDKELIAEGYFLVYQFNKTKGSDQAIHFLIGAKQYSFDWLQQKKPLIDKKDWQAINRRISKTISE
jgi:nucleoid DNA-binding protein